MSFIAKLYEKILMSTKPDYMDSQEKINEFLAAKEDQMPKSIFKSFNFNGMEVFHFGNRASSDKTIIFIHGGAYVNEINYQHFLYCWLLAKRLNAYVLAPAYPLAPNHSCDETFDLITDLYKEYCDDNLIMMGDSAGGGFVLSFCQYLKTIDLKQPNNIVVFSPWVDISMSNVYDSSNDPILGEVGLREIGKSWAGNLDTKDYLVSPLYGDNEGLPKTLIFAGDNEIFYEDIEEYVKNAPDVRLIVGNGLFHIYPMFPMPEAITAFKEIKKEIM
ncbi:alpha/beta hydrolase fold domain-containing protein [Methanobrevibacter sp.]|uniref:alpha/beta hydrolase fold domain-containing protein n=1 Tax=Methanobrevibacter sp. TaxID=66852 RepID=UPI00388E95A0